MNAVFEFFYLHSWVVGTKLTSLLPLWSGNSCTAVALVLHSISLMADCISCATLVAV